MEYSAFIAGELRAELDRRDAANSRATTMLSASTGLVTVITVVTATRGRDFSIGGVARWLLLCALIAMLITAIMSLTAGIAKSYKVTTIDTLHQIKDVRWEDAESYARKVVVYCNLHTLEDLRVGTNLKYKMLRVAAMVQIGAVLLLSVCLVLTV
ncbi:MULTISPECIES: hypothetical protein [unclassified Nocardia]|uniref:hypothetical protein n=1 Tax=unclassified Nocardia TaxID=2637762 RepID=UPI001CE3B632|nr:MULTISPECIES: hypothetical protein [unclassified Nocardia]